MYAVICGFGIKKCNLYIPPLKYRTTDYEGKLNNKAAWGKVQSTMIADKAETSRPSVLRTLSSRVYYMYFVAQIFVGEA